MIKTRTRAVKNPYDALGSLAELNEPSNPFRSDKGVDGLMGSLESAVSGIDCIFDASMPLGFPLRYVMETPAKKRDSAQTDRLSRFYKQFIPLFAKPNIIITPTVKHALIRLIFYGRINLSTDESPSASQLDKQLDLLHRTACHKKSHAPNSLCVTLSEELDSEVLSAVHEAASYGDEIIGFATRNRAQILKISEIAEKSSAEGKALPIELISYDPKSGEYQRRSLYRMKDVFSAAQTSQ